MTGPAEVWALSTQLPLDEVNVALPALDAAGLLGMVEQDGVTTVYLARRFDVALAGTWSRVEDRDWNAVWKADLQPVNVGEVTIVAPWHERPRSGVTLVIEPGQAFGTGHHESTTACLAALQDVGVGGAAVLDVGTGTGVLALAAAALGAADVLGVDVDPVAVQTARDNARRNGLDVRFATGSVEMAADGAFDVVVANLTTTTIAELAVPLARRLAAGGTLIASGVSNERAAEAAEALSRAELDVAITAGTEWAVLRGQPRSAMT